MSTDLLLDISAAGIATLSMNRPQRHNAFDDQFIESFIQFLTELEQNPAMRVLILTGIGKSFSAGADLSWMQRMANYSRDENVHDAARLAELMRLLNSFSKPTIAAVNGAAFGGGVGLVACCDIALASPAASFCFSEVKLGLIPAVISPYVIAAIGPRQARRYFLTAERFDADTAHRIGLIHQQVAATDLLTTATAVAEMLVANGSHALTASKKLIAHVSQHPINAALIADTAQSIADIRVSPEAQSRLAEFLSKNKLN